MRLSSSALTGAQAIGGVVTQSEGRSRPDLPTLDPAAGLCAYVDESHVGRTICHTQTQAVLGACRQRQVCPIQQLRPQRHSHDHRIVVG